MIKAWERGIATMKRGEKAVLVCSHKLAYGKRGRPPMVPPLATLAFCIHLVEWHRGEDLVGSMGVLKTLLQPGAGSETPGKEDVCEGTSSLFWTTGGIQNTMVAVVEFLE